jgi:amylosucrase
MSYTGIPLLYRGDEIGQLNDWSYKEDPEHQGDSRWLHRGRMDWKAAENRNDLGTVEGQIFTRLKQMIDIRKSSEIFSAAYKSIPVDTGNNSVFCFHKGDKMLVLANFSEHEQWVDSRAFDWFGLPGEMSDMITGRPVRSYNNHILLGPYEYLWLV